MVSRRQVIGYAGAGGIGVVAGGLIGRATVPEPSVPELQVIQQSYSPHELHQAGIVTPAPAAHTLVAFNLLPDTQKGDLARLMRVWSTDISALMAGKGVPGDTAPELAQANVSLAITVGFGPGVFKLDGLAALAPDGFIEIPEMKHDRLDPAWCGGDLLVEISADDQTSVQHAASRLTKDAAPFAEVAWVQDGFWRTLNAAGSPVTGRNLLGQVDGTANPTGDVQGETLWAVDPPAWFAGGTTLVVRRIEYDLAGWDRLVRDRQEAVIGRDLATGAPLTGTKETDPLDLDAQADGEYVIALNAHSRRANPAVNNGRRIYRRGLNYVSDTVVDGKVVQTTGLIFQSFQANIAKQFVPLQQQLDDLDALNEWTYAIGSAVFAIPGGFPEGGWLGQELLEG